MNFIPWVISSMKVISFLLLLYTDQVASLDLDLKLGWATISGFAGKVISLQSNDMLIVPLKLK